MNDIEAAREKRKQREREARTSREDDITVWMWAGENRIEAVQFSVRDRDATPIYTNRQRADIMFDALWQSTSEDAEDPEADNDRVCYTVYLDNNGRTWTRVSDLLLDGKVGWPHGKWLLKRAWDVAKPLLLYAMLCTLKPYRSRWPLRHWKWFNGKFTD